MPLVNGSSRAAVSENIRREVNAGKPQRQAVAIALDIARRSKRAEGGAVDEMPIVLPRRQIDLTTLPPSATEYKPTFRDRIARTMIGDAPPSPERRQFVSGLMGSTGIGSTGVGLVDLTPAGVPLAVNDAGKAGDLQQAALAAMPAMLGGSGVAAASQGQQGNDGMKDGGAIDSSLRIARQYAGGGMTPWYTRAQARQMTHTGPLHSPIAGRTDHIPLNVPAGSYVLPADVVSGLGQGNTTAGMKVVDHMFSSGPYGMGLKGTRGRNSMPRAPRAPRTFAEGGEVGDEPVEIVAAGGEYVLSPEEVAIVGNGDMDLGHRILDAFVLKVRKDTVNTLKTLPPPAKD